MTSGVQGEKEEEGGERVKEKSTEASVTGP